MNHDALLAIAKKTLMMETLDTRNSGEDFEEQAVWCIRQALEQAYQQGVSDTEQRLTQRQ